MKWMKIRIYFGILKNLIVFIFYLLYKITTEKKKTLSIIIILNMIYSNKKVITQPKETSPGPYFKPQSILTIPKIICMEV